MADGEGRRTILVCESTGRWKRALRYSFDQKQTSGAISSVDGVGSVVLRGVTVGEARAMMVHVRPLVVMWELTEEGALPIMKAISIGSRSQHPPLQIACMPARFECTPAQSAQLALDVRQLGVAALLQNPEELGLASRLIERYFVSWKLALRHSPKSADLDNA